MKRVLVRGTPHWEEDNVRLPIIAGGDHIPGHIGTAGGEGTNTLRQGQILTAADGQRWIAVDTGFGWRLVPEGERATATSGVPLPPTSTWVTETGDLIEVSGSGQIVGSRALPSSQFFGGGGTAAPAFSSTREAADLAFEQQQQLDREAFDREQHTAAERRAFDREQAEALQAFTREQNRLAREFEAEQDRLGREATAEQNRLAQEAANKRQRLGVLSDLIQGFVSSQAQARTTLANLQPDPFRFAAVAGGIAPFGVTPQQGFQEQLQQFAGAPVPQFDPNAGLPSIESAIQGLTGAQVPLPPQVFGAAGGASIPAPPPGQSVAVKVGERGEEVLRITAQGVEVIPLAGGMQAGGTIGFPFEPIPFEPVEIDAETLLPALETSGIFGSLGFDQLPTAQRFSPFRGLFPQGGRTGFHPGNLERLGIRPGLIRFSDDPTVFFRNPQTGELQPFTSLEQFGEAGFGRGNITTLRPAARGEFEFGGAFTERPISTEARSPFTRFSAPIIEPTTQTLLPAPFMVARQMNRLRLTDPFKFNLLLSAYKSAGVPATAVLSGVQSALPFGQERGSIGLR